MLEPVSVGLKFAFLIVLYLFLLWVSRSALKDLRRGAAQVPAVYGEPVQAPPDATGLHSASSSMGAAADGFEPRLVVERAPGHTPGMEHEIGGGGGGGGGGAGRRARPPPPRPPPPPAGASPPRGPHRRARGPRLHQRHLP